MLPGPQGSSLCCLLRPSSEARAEHCTQDPQCLQSCSGADLRAASATHINHPQETLSMPKKRLFASEATAAACLQPWLLFTVLSTAAFCAEHRLLLSKTEVWSWGCLPAELSKQLLLQSATGSDLLAPAPQKTTESSGEAVFPVIKWCLQ